MSQSLKLLALVTVLFFGAAGWGAIAVAVLQRAGWKGAAKDLGFAMRVILGVSLFLAVGGFLVAIGIARPPVLLAWHAVGLLYLLSRCWPLQRRKPRAYARVIVRDALLSVVGLFLLLMSIGYAIGIPFYNPPDDDPGYVYLAQRLVSTGGLIDPFNLRRFASFGGSSLYQSLFLRITGNASLRGFELTFGALLLLVVVVATVRRRWLVLFVLLVGLGILIGQGIGPIINLSPTYSVAALSVGTYQLLSKIRDPSEGPQQPLLFVVLGVVLAAILAFRWAYLLSVLFAVVLVIGVLLGRKALRGLILIGGTSLICSAGWAIALYRSSGTPLPIGGNYNPFYPGGNTPYLNASTLASKVWDVFNSYGVGQVALLSALIAAGYLLFTTRQSKQMLVLLCASLGCLLQLVFVTYIFSGSVLGDIARFIAPSSLACALFALATLWPTRPASSPAAIDETTAPFRLVGTWAAHFRLSGSRVGPFIRNQLAMAVTVILLFVIVAVSFGNLPKDLFSPGQVVAPASGMHRVGLGWHVLVGSSGFGDRYDGSVRTEYRQLNVRIPPGAQVLAAVEYPGLLDLSKFQFATLDIPGAVSPPPHMPYFQGGPAKVAYLRHLGYQYIVSEYPASSGDLYGDWPDFLHSTAYFRRAYASYFADWQSTVTGLENSQRYHVAYFGRIALIDIRVVH